MIEPEVRLAVPEDVEALRELTLAFTPKLAAQVSIGEFAARVRRRTESPEWHIAVAAVGEKLIGYVAAQDFGTGLRTPFAVGRMHDLYVLPGFRGSGVGRRLVDSAVAWARAREYPFIMDWQAPREAVPFYESMGFTADWRGDYQEHPGFSLDTQAS